MVLRSKENGAEKVPELIEFWEKNPAPFPLNSEFLKLELAPLTIRKFRS